MSDSILVQHLDHCAVCTLNRPDKRNPISPAIRADLCSMLEQLLKKGTRCVIFTGSGSAFCSGLDLEGLSAQSQFSPAEHAADSKSIADFFEFIRTYPLPTIAAVNGPAVAGGCGLALLCDITLAVPESFFSFSEVKIGFVPALVGVYLERMIGAKAARDLLLTGRRVPADEALQLGLINAVVPAAELLDRAAKLAETLAQNGPDALKLTKELLTKAAGMNLPNALKLAVEVNARARVSAECREGVAAFLAKRNPSWADRKAEEKRESSAGSKSVTEPSHSKGRKSKG